MNITEPHILLFVTLILLITVTLRSCFLRRNMLRSNARINEIQQQLVDASEKIEKLEEIEKRFHDFNSDLQQAEIATRVQRSRHTFHQPAEEAEPPEKYRYIQSLARKGIGAADIATILTISTHEADQLVKLANLSRSD